MVKKILQFEGIVCFVFSVFLYWKLEGNWFVFLFLILTPDISMIGYIKDKKIGAIVYNTVHNYILAAAILLIGILLPSNLIVLFGLILTAHIGIDRFFGYGLKYRSGFKDTHLQKV